MAEEKGYMIDTEMKRTVNQAFLQTAIDCEPDLLEREVVPTRLVRIFQDCGKVSVTEDGSVDSIDSIVLGKGDALCLDFGDHQVGYVTLKMKSVGSPQDAPAYIRFKFGEMPNEILEKSEEYDGWISRSWIQEEFLHIDVLPAVITLPRRYAFRYLEIFVVDTSPKWKLVVEEASVKAVSSVAMEDAELIETQDELLGRIDRVSLRTLHNCMQTVFEDGPKRDRRLWLGDLRLQALANYETFQKNDLVKRCLYLFGGLTRDDGRIGACLFTEPDYLVDDTYFFDYALFFIPTLSDYYEATEDRKALEELWDIAYRQIELSREQFDTEGLVHEDVKCFIDWKEGLNKQAGGQAVYIYCLKKAMHMAGILGKEEIVRELSLEIKEKEAAARKYLWDEEKGFFVSGKERQISYANQAWMILADVVTEEEGGEILDRLDSEQPEMGMVTPYMNHHYVEALLKCGRKEKALDFLKYYWGGMVKEGADTFFELYNPQNPNESPYGSSMVNSYCHAWSCTPAYLLRKYF